jgi:hypothetical protein
MEDDRTFASFGGVTCMSVASHSVDHSLASSHPDHLDNQHIRRLSSQSGLSDFPCSSGIFSSNNTTTASQSSYHEAMRILTSSSNGGGGNGPNSFVLENNNNNNNHHYYNYDASVAPTIASDASVVLDHSSSWMHNPPSVIRDDLPPPPPLPVLGGAHRQNLDSSEWISVLSSGDPLQRGSSVAAVAPSVVVPTTQTATTTTMTMTMKPPPVKSLPPSRDEKPVVVKAKQTTTKTKWQKEQGMVNGRKIRRLIAETGTQHVYFGRGEPIRNNPGNIRFRNIVDKYYGEYQRASKDLKLEIKNKIEAEVTSDGTKFIVVVETKGNVSQEPASDRKVKDGTGHVLRDTPKRRSSYWSWADPSTAATTTTTTTTNTAQDQQLSWSNFAYKDGAALEQMFQEDLQCRTKVKVTVRREDHLVDVTSMMMHPANANATTYLLVRRLEPEEDEMEGREPIWVSGDSDGQYDASSSTAKSSASQSSGASWTSNSSSSYPAGSGGGAGGGGVQSSLYCSLGMAQASKDESPVFAFEALQVDIWEEITKALEEERSDQEERGSFVSPVSSSLTNAKQNGRLTHDEEDDEDISALRPPPRGPTDSGSTTPTPVGGGGGTGRGPGGLVKRLKNKVKFGSALPFGKKKETTTESEQQNLGIPIQETIWVWRENKTRMSKHSVDSIVGDPNDCWVRYDEESSAVLEASYQAQNGVGECSANSNYTVDFGLMRQINIATGFQRQVRRLESTSFLPLVVVERGHDSTTTTKRGIVDIVRKLGNMRVQEHHDDMTTASAYTAPTTADETSMGLDDGMTFYLHSNVV